LKNAQYLLEDMVVTDAIEERSHDGDTLLESCGVWSWKIRDCNKMMNAEGEGSADYMVKVLHSCHKMTEEML
jgi:hypothetical protein